MYFHTTLIIGIYFHTTFIAICWSILFPLFLTTSTFAPSEHFCHHLVLHESFWLSQYSHLHRIFDVHRSSHFLLAVTSRTISVHSFNTSTKVGPWSFCHFWLVNILTPSQNFRSPPFFLFPFVCHF